jgi:hypothetical protein
MNAHMPQIAVQEIRGITTTSLFRSQAVMCSYFQRSQLLAAYQSDDARFQLLAARAWNMSVAMEEKNWKLYESTRTGSIGQQFDQILYTVQSPVGDSWVPVNVSYFGLISELARRVRIGTTCTMQEMRDGNWVLKDASERKKNIAFV